jgi:hypothetical protein
MAYKHTGKSLRDKRGGRQSKFDRVEEYALADYELADSLFAAELEWWAEDDLEELAQEECLRIQDDEDALDLAAQVEEGNLAFFGEGPRYDQTLSWTRGCGGVQ